MLKAVVMNDTSTRYHHGCARVMRVLLAGLERNGIRVIARSHARNKWEQDTNFLNALTQADLVIINGEGTLHHGKPDGERLLKIAHHPVRANKPIALINALYQDNPNNWGRYLSDIELIAARDSKSANAIQIATKKEIRWLPDLSLSEPVDIQILARQGVLVGDSVRLEQRRVLAETAQALPDALYMPTKSLNYSLFKLPLLGGVALAMLYRLYNGVFPLYKPRFEMARDEFSYLHSIAESELHITGRFHATCFSMLVETPFIALTSNASKIESLLDDAGLDSSRVVDKASLSPPPTSAPFSTNELRLIRDYRNKAQQEAERLFFDIAALARA